MKAIILAAGQGTRLKPLTNDRPKCMVEYLGRPIIDYILDVIYSCGINDIAIVGGYKIDVLRNYLNSKKITFFENRNYETTNMLSTLFCAKEWLNDDLIISYADIMYSHDILKMLIEEQADISTTVDKNWFELWQQRMPNPLDDAETLKLDSLNNIIELGRKPKDYSDIQGQYMGLIKIKKDALQNIVDFYESIDRGGCYDGKDFNNMYMTSFLQMIIDKVMPIKAVVVGGGWLEVDSLADLNIVLSK